MVIVTNVTEPAFTGTLVHFALEVKSFDFPSMHIPSHPFHGFIHVGDVHACGQIPFDGFHSFRRVDFLDIQDRQGHACVFAKFLGCVDRFEAMFMSSSPICWKHCGSSI